MQHEATIDFHLVRDFNAKMNATYAFLRLNFKRLLKSLVFIAGPPILLSGILLSEIFNQAIRVSGNSNANAPINAQDYFSSSDFWLQLMAGFLFLLIGGVFTLSTLYGYMFAYQEHKGMDFGLNDVWKMVRKLFWKNFFSMILYFLGMLLGIVVLFIPLYLVMLALSWISPVFAVMGAVMYYVVLFFLIIYFSMVFVISNYENTDFFTSLGRLHYLCRNQLWNTFTIGAINFYIQTVLSFLLIIPWYIYLYIAELHNSGANGNATVSWAGEIFSNFFWMAFLLFNTLLYTLPLVGIAFQYFSLAELKESKGLLKKIERFGQAAPKKEHVEDF